MTTDEALKTLKEGGEWTTLAEAIGVVMSDPLTSYEALMLGLKHKGFVAGQAAMALYRRSFRPLPDDRRTLVTDPDEWRRWLKEQSEQDVRATGHTVKEIAEGGRRRSRGKASGKTGAR